MRTSVGYGSPARGRRRSCDAAADDDCDDLSQNHDLLGTDGSAGNITGDSELEAFTVTGKLKCESWCQYCHSLAA